MPRIDEVWYELDLRTKEFDRNIKHAEDGLKKLAKTVMTHPVGATLALSAALGAAALEAAHFAEEIETPLRRAGVLSQPVARELGGIQRALEGLASEVPLALGDLAHGFEQIVKSGTRDPAAAMAKLGAAARGAVASGQDLSAVIGTLTQVMDAFQLPATKAESTMDLLFAAAKHGADLAQLGPVLEHVGANAHQAGVSLNELIAAAVAMLNAGESTQQVARSLNLAFGDQAERAHVSARGTAALATQIHVLHGHLQLAGQGARDYAGALEEVSQAQGSTREGAREMSESADAQYKLVKNQLAVEWLHFGTAVLPLITEGFRALNGLIATFNGTVENIRFDSAVHAIETIAANIRKLKPEQQAKELERLELAMNHMVGGGGVTALVTADRIHQMTDAQLQAFRDGLVVVQAFDKALDNAQRETVLKNFLQADAELAARAAHRPKPPAGASADTGGGAPPAPPLTPEQLAARQAILDQATEIIARANGSLTAELQKQYDDLLRAATQRFGHDLPAVVQTALDALRVQVAEANPVQEILDSFDRIKDAAPQAFQDAQAGFFDPALELFNELQSQDQAVQAMMTAVPEGSEQWKKLRDVLKQIRDLADQIAQHTFDIGDAGKDTADTQKKSLEQLQQQAQTIERAARGAIQLAQAFGLVDQNAARALESVAEIAANIPGALKGDASSILGVMGGLASLVSSLSGDSAAERERRKVLQENSDALQKLTRELGNFGLNIAGNMFAGAQTAVANAIAERPPSSGDLSGPFNALTLNALRQELSNVGLSMQDLIDLAKELGVTLDPNDLAAFGDELRQLQEAMQKEELTRFAHDVGAQMDLLSLKFKLFDISQPVAQLQQLVDVLTDADIGVPALRQALAGIDITTPEGRAKAQAALQALFQQLQTGTLTDASQLGSLTLDQFAAAIGQLMDALSAANQQVGTGQTAQFTVDRTITEVTGNRIAAYLATGTAYAQQTAEHTALIARLLAGIQNPTPLVPPSAADVSRALATAPAGSGIAVDTINVTIPLPAGASATDATALGSAAADAFLARLDQTMGVRIRRRRVAGGALLLS